MLCLTCSAASQTVPLSALTHWEVPLQLAVPAQQAVFHSSPQRAGRVALQLVVAVWLAPPLLFGGQPEQQAHGDGIICGHLQPGPPSQLALQAALESEEAPHQAQAKHLKVTLYIGIPVCIHLPHALKAEAVLSNTACILLEYLHNRTCSLCCNVSYSSKLVAACREGSLLSVSPAQR